MEHRERVVCCCSLIVPNSLRLYGLQHARFFYPLLFPGVCSNSCPLSWWCYASNHLILCRPLLLLPSIFPSIKVFSVSRLFASGVQSIGASASVSVLPVNIQGWFPLGLRWLKEYSLFLDCTCGLDLIRHKRPKIGWEL